jgi:hypothetical protein
MDFAKLQSLLDKGIIINLEGADDHELQYSYDNFATRHELTPEKYRSEEEIASLINSNVKGMKSNHGY